LREPPRHEHRREKARTTDAQFSPDSQPLHTHAAPLTRLLIRAKASPYVRVLERNGRIVREEDTTAARIEQAWDGH